MDTEIVKEVARKIEALDALAKLFKNLWYEQIRKDIKDEKIQAYLTVFDDAFPDLNYVIDFVRRSAEVMADSGVAQDQQLKLEEEFEILHSLLIDKESEHVGSEISFEIDPLEDELSSQEKAALESVDQNDIEDLFIDESTDGIGDALDSDGEDDSGDDKEEIEQHGSKNKSDSIGEELGGAKISEDEMLALLDDDVSNDDDALTDDDASKKNDDDSLNEDEIDALFG